MLSKSLGIGGRYLVSWRNACISVFWEKWLLYRKKWFKWCNS